MVAVVYSIANVVRFYLEFYLIMSPVVLYTYLLVGLLDATLSRLGEA